MVGTGLQSQAYDTMPLYSNYLPDELLLEVLAVIQKWDVRSKQLTLHRFCAVNRQWYDVAVRLLYEAPYIIGGGYDLFVRTICPSVNSHIKKTPLANLVQTLNLAHIVHQGSKSTTSRLLGRTKASLRIFVAPQASFAINCWASLSKCSKLRVLDLSLVSECISFQALDQTVRQLPELRDLYLPRCSSRYGGDGQQAALSMNIRWPPRLQHLSLSGSVSGKFLWDMLKQTDNFPPGFYSLSMLHAPRLDAQGIRSLLLNLAQSLTVVELRELPAVKQGRLSDVLSWLPRLTSLTIALDYIDRDFGSMPADFSAARWEEAQPLQRLCIVTSGQTGDEATSFTAVDLYALIDERWLGRLRYLDIAVSTGWQAVNEGAELGALEHLLCEELDRENWEKRRWHYRGIGGVGGMPYERWIKETEKGWAMRPRMRVLGNRLGTVLVCVCLGQLDRSTMFKYVSGVPMWKGLDVETCKTI